MENKIVKNNTILIAIVLAVVVGVIGFFAGMEYQKSQARQSFAQGGLRGQFANGASGVRGGNGGNGAARPVYGDILSLNDNSITVKMQDGSTKIVLVTGSTTINKATEGSKSDLTEGERVGVFGTTNSDGSVTAQNIQLNPNVRGINPVTSGQPTPTSTAK